MPANLTPQYLGAELRFKQATTIQEKIEALEEMMALIPKHKGTEKMRADLRRRMAKLRADTGKKHGVSKASAMYTVRREGAGQVVLVGAPNVGKSLLLSKLTKAVPEIADYPFTTRLPQPGMMPFENIQIQIVDLPAIASEYYEGWVGHIIRSASLALLIVDLGSDDLLEEVDDVLNILDASNIRLIAKPPADAASLPSTTFRETLLVANKSDAPRAAENLEILREFYGDRFEILPISATLGQGLESLRQTLFERLDIVRIYTKIPGKKADLTSPPFVLKSGSTVLDLAKAVHRDFAGTLKYAKKWSSPQSKGPLKYDGQMVERNHVLEDGDILELHG